jgi:hypothetical protein
MTLKAAKATRDVNLIMESRRALRDIAGATCLQQLELLRGPCFLLATFDLLANPDNPDFHLREAKDAGRVSSLSLH